MFQVGSWRRDGVIGPPYPQPHIPSDRVRSEKIESLRLNSFGLLHSLTIQMKYRISAGLVLIALLVPEMSSCLET